MAECTCHPSDTSRPCMERYTLSECIQEENRLLRVACEALVGEIVRLSIHLNLSRSTF